jgi:hypothetical protein
MVDLLIRMRPRIGSLCEFEPPSLHSSRGPVEGSACLVIILPKAFSLENREVKSCHVFLVGRIMVLDELLTGQFEWGRSSRSWGSSMGQLVTDPRFLTASPSSSQVRLTSPKGSSPFFEEKPWTLHDQDLNVGQDALGARTPGY